MQDCPVCSDDHPTGQHTATFGGLTHRSVECGAVASNAGVGLLNIGSPRVRGALAAAKRKFEAEGLPATCPRCGFFCGDGSNCQRCGIMLRL